MTQPRVDLTEAQRLTEAASEGPWTQTPETHAGKVWVQMGDRGRRGDLEPLFSVRSTKHGRPSDDDFAQRERDAEFIAWCRTAVPDLIGELTEARQQLEAVLALHHRHGDSCITCGDGWPCLTVLAALGAAVNDSSTEAKWRI